MESLPEFMQELPVYVQDGLDPSDSVEVGRLEHLQGDDYRGPERIELL